MLWLFFWFVLFCFFYSGSFVLVILNQFFSDMLLDLSDILQVSFKTTLWFKQMIISIRKWWTRMSFREPKSSTVMFWLVIGRLFWLLIWDNPADACAHKADNQKMSEDTSAFQCGCLQMFWDSVEKGWASTRLKWVSGTDYFLYLQRKNVSICDDRRSSYGGWLEFVHSSLEKQVTSLV